MAVVIGVAAACRDIRYQRDPHREAGINQREGHSACGLGGSLV